MEEQNEMEKIVTPMMEHVCDHLCRFPWEIERKEDLEEVCAGCQMDQYTNLILNQYNKIYDFEKSQCAHLLKELAMERAKRENMVADWKWHLTERFSRVV
jgi:hypothetical protein